MSTLQRILCFAIVSMLAACAAPPPQGNLGPAQEAAVMAKANEFITQRRWLDAYLALDPALTSTDQAEVERALALAARHPELLKAADSVFEVDSLFNFMVERGRNVGRDLAIIRLGAYRKVATQEGLRLARANIDQAYDRFDKEEAERRRAAQDKEKAELEDLQKSHAEAAARARFVCRTPSECDKAFAITQIFVSEFANTKIQTANNTIIETFNPTNGGDIGMKAVKFPRGGTTSEIILSIGCNAGVSKRACLLKEVVVYQAYPKFIAKNLVN